MDSTSAAAAVFAAAEARRQRDASAAAMAAAAEAERRRRERESGGGVGDDRKRREAAKEAQRRRDRAAGAAAAAAGASGRSAAAAAKAAAAYSLPPKQLWAQAEAQWDAFASAPPAAFGLDGVPWPDLALIKVVAMASPDTVDFRALQARWHPDRFTQKFGGRVVAAQRDAVLARVNEVAAAVNAMRRDLGPKA
jgi:hypothetical protein